MSLRALFLTALLIAPAVALSQPQPWLIGPFTRPPALPGKPAAPILAPNHDTTFLDPIAHKPVHWETLHTFNPAAVLAPDGTPAVLYRAEDDTGEMRVGGHTSRLGLATSTDGLTLHRLPQPVFYMDNDAQAKLEVTGGVEDPRLVQTVDGLYVLTYTQHASGHHIHSVGIATSRDLRHWTKYGPAFDAAENGRYKGLVYKSAGILTELRHGRLVAAKLHGKYWMYWGEGTIGLATSADLIHWAPVLDPATHAPIVLLAARPGHFDSGFPETGPPPVLTARGIVMLYNAKNSAAGSASGGTDPGAPIPGAPLPGDPTLAAGTYSVGEALFSTDDPAKLLDRTAQPVFKPETPYEKTGQYLEGTVFAEGLVAFKGRWLLYYGCADSFVGVATAPIKIR